MDRQSQVSRWIAAAKQRGGAPFLLTLLDTIEPLAPVLAQGLLVAEPWTNWWRRDGGLRELADLLEEPEGFKTLRRQLADDPTE